MLQQNLLPATPANVNAVLQTALTEGVQTQRWGLRENTFDVLLRTRLAVTPERRAKLVRQLTILTRR